MTQADGVRVFSDISTNTHSGKHSFSHAYKQTNPVVNREREPRLVRISQPSPASAAAKRQRRRRWLPVKAIAAILILTTAMIMMMRIFSWEDLLSCHRMLSPVFHPKQISHVGKPDQFQPISPIPRRDIVDQNHFFSNRTMLFFAISQASSFSSLLFHTNTLSNTNFSWTLFTLLEVAPLLFGHENHFSGNPNHQFNHQTNVFRIDFIRPNGSDCAN